MVKTALCEFRSYLLTFDKGFEHWLILKVAFIGHRENTTNLEEQQLCFVFYWLCKEIQLLVVCRIRVGKWERTSKAKLHQIKR